MSDQSSSTTTPQSQSDPTGLVILLVVVVSVLVAAPALVLGLVVAAVLRQRRQLVPFVGVLALAGAGVVYFWHQEIWVSMLAARDIAYALVGRNPAYSFGDLWDVTRSMWLRTWPAIPLVGLALDLLHKPTDEERERQQQMLQQQMLQREDRRAFGRAAKAPDSVRVQTAGQVEELMVIGAAGPGDALRAKSAPQWAVYPRSALNRHGVVLGESGKGKSEFLLRLAYGARKVYGWRVYFIDGKGSPAFADQFRATMVDAGCAHYHHFPNFPFDGWRGDRELVYNKLVAALEYSEPFYKNTVETATRLAVFAEDQPPRNSTEFLARFDMAYLSERYAHDPAGMRRLNTIKKEHLDSAYMRYDAFLSAIGADFNGNWSFEDADAAYFLLDMVAKREQGRAAGRFLIEDFTQAITHRIPPGEFALFIIDEYPALAGAGEAAKLFEQVRSPRGRGGAGVFITSQSYAGLGEDADRMLQAANATIAFQQSDTQRIAERAGERMVKRKAYSVGQQSQPGQQAQRRMETFSQREERDYALSPDEIRRLQIGQCYVIPSGAYQKVTVSRVPLSDEQMRLAHGLNSLTVVRDRELALHHQRSVAAHAAQEAQPHQLVKPMTGLAKPIIAPRPTLTPESTPENDVDF